MHVLEFAAQGGHIDIMTRGIENTMGIYRAIIVHSVRYMEGAGVFCTKHSLLVSLTLKHSN